jgi:hypothetical protein
MKSMGRPVFAALLVAASFFSPAAIAQEETTTFYVVHGIPGRDLGPEVDPRLPVDVRVAGEICLVEGLVFGEVAGPFTVPAGSYGVEISPASSTAPCSNEAVITGEVRVAADRFNSVVAALDPGGAPTAYVFRANPSAIRDGRTRLVANHAAAAPAVKILVDGKVAIRNLAPGASEAAVVLSEPGSVSLEVQPAGSRQTVLGPAPVATPPRSVVLGFVVGSAESGSLALIEKTIPGVF